MKIAVGCALTLPAQAEILWGTATAAYQVEGARDVDGRQPSIWDAYDTDGVSSVIQAKKPNGKPNVFNGENAAVADDDYVKYEDSVDIMHDYGFATARLSISWPRVMSFTLDANSGRPIATRNQAGIDHYKAVLKAYNERNVAPAVTMWHWDLPLALEEYAMSQACGSFWLCHEWLGDYFEEYAQLLMDEFADLTSWWITLNEPLTIISNGYAAGSHAPGRCSDRTQCWYGDSSTEPYLAAKGLTLAHARAFRVWEKAGRPGQGLGITLNGDWRIPQTDSVEDHDALTRSLEWSVAIFADPVHYGRWPKSMVDTLGDRLPPWTADEVELVNGTHDGHFFMNTYTTNFVRAAGNDGCGYSCDSLAETSGYNFETHEPVGTPSTNGWLFNYGPGMAKLIEWYDARYPGLSYIVTENGWGSATNSMEEEAASDVIRCNFYRDYLGNMSAMTARTGIDVKAYFAWSLMDNYEWADGFSVRFGLTYVDYDTQIRTPKMSAQWFKKYITPLKDLPTDGKPLPACDASVFTGSPLIV